MIKITFEFYDYIFICEGSVIEKDFFDKETGDEIAKKRAEDLSYKLNKIVAAARLLD